MLRFLIITINLLYSGFTLAQSSVQIDLILFTHPENGSTHSELDSSSPLIPVSHNAIPLKKNTGKTISSYSLLSPSQSGLKNEYYLLSHKSRYQVLGHYSWRQPAKNQSSVALPELNHNGWIVQGTIRVKQSNYYLLDTDIHFSPSNNPQSSLTIAQKQRLKGSEVYYLDHPRVGMLIKIHKIA